MRHWVENYIGRPYVEKEFDCGVLAETVQREIFGRKVTLPSERAYVGKDGVDRFEAMVRQIRENLPGIASRTEAPVEGDGVLLISRGRGQHIGIYCVVDGQPSILHAADASKMVVRTRISELEIRGMKVEGYYKWIL